MALETTPSKASRGGATKADAGLRFEIGNKNAILISRSVSNMVSFRATTHLGDNTEGRLKKGSVSIVNGNN